MEWKKNSVAVRLSIEELTMFSSGDWRRKVDYVEEIPVSEVELEEYQRAIRLRDELLSLDCAWDADIDIELPEPRKVYHYAETREEWEARVRAKINAGEQPNNVWQEAIIGPDTYGMIFGHSPLMEMRDGPAHGQASFKLDSPPSP